jgi:hypothetical protein
MRQVLLALAIALACLAAASRTANADGWGTTSGGCFGESDSTGCGLAEGAVLDCQCDSRAAASRQAASVGTSLGLVSLVAYRLRRRRRSR